jgi:hypothetical protein
MQLLGCHCRVAGFQRRHDIRAIAIWWQNVELDFVPRRCNRSALQLLDRGQPLTATHSMRRRHDNPRERLRLCVEVESHG